jgi:tetratricopeptide (TPR) repeat protein
VFRVSALALLALGAACSRAPQPAPSSADAGYINAQECAPCHFAETKKYRNTGMGRSFRSTTEAPDFIAATGTFVHAASGLRYEFRKQNGRFYLKRTSSEGEELEKEIHYAVGSGIHAQTYLHRTSDGRLLQLPVSWYAENGGTLAMSPGYDTAAHPDFRRAIRADCLFCHNAYPGGEVSSQGDARWPEQIPNGIDCQRCHGPGRAHLDAVKAGKPAAAVRAAIVNPKRLAPDRELEVCMQCHLETTSFELPNAIHRFGRGVFSYRPGEPLGDYQLQFDHAPGMGHEDKFEIAGAAYRLRQSACFLKSNGALRCSTCHNPHDIPRGDAARTHHAAVCNSCHQAVLADAVKKGRHPAGADCAGCHMPKRRTEDVVHAAMTDHKIQRRKSPGDLLAPRAERHHKPGQGYRGEVVLYYPPSLPPGADRDLYLAAAQVTQGANIAAGIPALRQALDRHKPARPEFYVELGLALAASGDKAGAATAYRQALDRDANWLPALRGLGTLESNAALLEKARALDPRDAATLQELARAHHAAGDQAKAYDALTTAANADPDSAEIREALAGMQMGRGELAAAEQNYQQALRLNPAAARARFGFATLLAGTGRFPEAERQIDAALRTNPDLAEAQEMRASLYARTGEWRRAVAHYRAALAANPNFGRAALGLGTALAATGDMRGARGFLQQAAADPDPAIRAEAADILGEVNRRLR